MIRMVAVGLCLLAYSGCGPSAPNLPPVSGVVTVDGKPRNLITVILKPDAAAGNAAMHEPRGCTDDEGRYTVRSSIVEGAPAGKYKVGLMMLDPEHGATGTPAVAPFNARYANPDTSGLTIEVSPDPAQDAYDFHSPKLSP